MRLEELDELHYITPIANVPSIVTHGILSHKRVKSMQHQSVAKPEVQALRAKVHIPGGRWLHEYANLYICARNPMMYVRRGRHESICILRVSTDVLELAEVVVTDQNAASPYCLFKPASSGLSSVDLDMVFADDWRHPGNPPAYYRHRSVKCAEILVPDSVSSEFIMGAYVSCRTSHDQMAADSPGMPVEVNRHLFFR